MNVSTPSWLGATFVLLAHCGRADSSAPSSAAARPAAPAAPAAAASIRVDSPARSEPIALGAPAPRFRAVAHNGAVVESNGPRARPLVVYFYPRDETPGCTVEAQGFRDAARDYAQANVDVVGVSTDDAASHSAFASHHNLGFPLVSDPNGALAAAFGVQVRMGFTQRKTFIISPAGIVKFIFNDVTPSGHATQVLGIARSLSTG
jgi:peroxiredoxin Q/BCP